VDKVIDAIVALWDRFVGFFSFCFTVKDWEDAIVLRFGKFNRYAHPGFHWKWPMMEKKQEDTVVTQTMKLDSQVISSKDGVVVAKGIIKYSIPDIRLFITTIGEAKDAMADITMGAIKKTLVKGNGEDTDNSVTIKARSEIKKYGIYIEQVTLVSHAKTRAINLFHDYDERSKEAEIV